MVLKVVGAALAPKKKGKAEAKEAVPVPADDLRTRAHEAYRDFQRGWFTFAKLITEIKTGNAWEAYGHETFKEFCLEEYPDIPFATVSKFIAVIESWGGALEQRLLKSPDEPLPSYDACYELAVHEERIPKEELPKLRKSILERQLTRSEVRERCREFRAKDGRARIIPEKTARKLDRELKAAEQKDKAEAKAEVDDLANFKDVKSETAAAQLLARAKVLADNLPALTASLKEATPTVIDLAEYLRDTQEAYNAAIDAFLVRVEELSNVEGEG